MVNYSLTFALRNLWVESPTLFLQSTLCLILFIAGIRCSSSDLKLKQTNLLRIESTRCFSSNDSCHWRRASKLTTHNQSSNSISHFHSVAKYCEYLATMETNENVNIERKRNLIISSSTKISVKKWEKVVDCLDTPGVCLGDKMTSKHVKIHFL